MTLDSRLTDAIPVAVTDALGTTQEIPFGGKAFGRIHIPTGSSITSLTWYDAYEEGGTYIASQDSTPAAVTQTVAAAKSYQIPETLYGAMYIKAVGDAAGTIYIVRKA